MAALTLGPITPGGVRAFGLVVGLVAGTACGAAALAVVSVQHATLAGLLTCAFVAGAGQAIPNLSRFAYRGWNRAARTYSRTARMIVTAVCFFVVVGITGRAGSSLVLRKPRKGESMWTPHENNDSRPSLSQYMGGTERELVGFRALMDWGRHSRNSWALALVPFFFLLLAFEADATYEAPADIYTLF